jgi:hypothetical protein
MPWMRSGRHRRRTAGIFAAGLTAALLAWAAPSVAASDWSVYGNPRFCYGVDVPPGFSVTAEPDNGNGVTMGSKETGARLLVWGTNLMDTFRTDAASRLEEYTHDGWRMTLHRIADGKASLSGSKGGQILYVRGIDLGDGQAAWFQLDYPQSRAKAFDPVVDRLVRSLTKGQECTGQ